MGRYFIFLLLSFLCACSAKLPSELVKEVPYVGTNLNPDADLTNYKNIKVFENQYPEGIEQIGNSFKVSKGHENKVRILGTTNVQLKTSYNDAMFFAFNGNYVKKSDISTRYRYCQKVLNGIQAPTFILLYMQWWAPYNWPCYGLPSYDEETPEDIKYREDALREELQKSAVKMGGNAVVGYSTSGISLLNQQGVTLSNSSAWNATGLIVELN